MAARAPDHLFEFDAGGLRRRSLYDLVEALLQPTGVAFQRGVRQFIAPRRYLAGLAELMPQIGADDVVSTFYRVLRVAIEMRDAYLIFLFCPSHLAVIAF